MSTTVKKSLSIYNNQKQALSLMLSSCSPARDVSEDFDDVWKVLIYDSVGRDILAPLFSVAELKNAGITLHMLLHNTRHPIPDVPAVYFVEPTEVNMARIALDAAKGTYGRLWISFTDFVSREVLEYLAESVATITRSNSLNGQIGYVYDRYSCFHSLQHNLFSLNLPGIYAALNAPNVSDDALNTLITKIVDRLFCVIVTMGVVPIIRAQKGGPANLIAIKLEERIREHLEMSDNVFLENKQCIDSSPQRLLLVLVNRELDIPVMLHHSWTYQALVHDVFGLKLNRVSVPVREDEAASAGNGSAVAGMRVFDLDHSDPFWSEHACLPFPAVAESVEITLQTYKDEVNELNRTTSTLGKNNVTVERMSLNSTKTTGCLEAAVSNIPELVRKKRLIDIHTNIASALLDEIKNRGLDGYYQVEEEMLSRPNNFDVERVLALIRDNRGSTTDKLRLFLIYFLCIENAGANNVKRCVDCLKSVGCVDFRAFNYLKTVRAFTQSMVNMPTTPLPKSSSIGGVYAASVIDTISHVASNVNKLILSTDKGLVAARDVFALMEAKTDIEVAERYILLDPKSPKGSVALVRSCKEAILFVAGPGNYIEYQNSQDYICSEVVQDGKKRRMIQNGKSIVYGATELCSGSEFLDQLHVNGVAKKSCSESSGQIPKTK